MSDLPGSIRNIYRCVFFEPRLGINFKFQNGKAFVSSYDEENFGGKSTALATPSSSKSTKTTSPPLHSNSHLDPVSCTSVMSTPGRASGLSNGIARSVPSPVLGRPLAAGPTTIPTASAVVASSCSEPGSVTATAASVVVLERHSISLVSSFRGMVLVFDLLTEALSVNCVPYRTTHFPVLRVSHHETHRRGKVRFRTTKCQRYAL